ncbi:ethanolamine utilization protein EutH [Escherichia coli]
MLAGIVTIPIGCIAGGLVAMYSGVQMNGQPVEFTFALILMNMIPVIIVAILVALGLKFIPEKMINGFQILPNSSLHRSPSVFCRCGSEIPPWLGTDPRTGSDLYGPWR